MKTVFSVLAILAFAAASEIEPYSVSSSFKDVLEGIRDDMPCGFPSLGIGPLAPLFVSQANVYLDVPSLVILSAVQNFTVNNLNRFEVLETKHSVVKRKFTFTLLFENVEVDTWYDLDSNFQDSSWTVKLVGSGNSYFAVRGLRLSVSTKYGINVADSRIKLKALKIVPHINSVVSRIEGILGNGRINQEANIELERMVPEFVNSFSEVISEKLEYVLLPVINKFLRQYSLNDILDGIGGNSVEGEKIKCQPPEQGVLAS